MSNTLYIAFKYLQEKFSLLKISLFNHIYITVLNIKLYEV